MSERVTRKKLEYAEGRGSVSHEGTRRFDANYELTVFQKFQEARTYGNRAAVQGLLGYALVFPRFKEQDIVDLVGKVLTLRLDDGREIDFFLNGPHDLNVASELRPLRKSA